MYPGEAVPPHQGAVYPGLASPCQLLPEPLSSNKRKGTWEFEVDIYLVTGLIVQ